MGSLSHTVNAEANGYIPLPDFPTEAPDPTVRDVADDSFWAKRPDSGKKSEKFYKNSDEDGSEGSDFYSSISGSEESGSEDSESDSEGMYVGQ